MILTVNDSNDDLIKDICTLYNDSKVVECDITYSIR